MHLRMNTKIVQEGENTALRLHASAVLAHDFGTKKLQDTIDLMFYLLKQEKDGVALAAPQIGLSQRIFVLSPHIFKNPRVEQLVYINPHFIKKSRKCKLMQEGCLSVRWLYGDVSRHEQVIVEAQDIHGNVFQRGASGLLAQIFQHETDHLNGKLFIDTAVNLERLPDEQIQNIKNS